MKKSEMVEKLIHHVICPHVVLYDGIQDVYRFRAEKLLEDLDRLGMLPPSYRISHNGGFCNCGECGSAFHRWEPEDEKE
jgi:hypothetical protein